MRDYWAEGSRTWVGNERLMDYVFRPVTGALESALDPCSVDTVLDVGCGAGTLTEMAVARAARAVDVDVDIAEPMVEAAREPVPDATFVVADAQVADLAAPITPDRFTAVTSRLGVMFFEDPTAAFANIRMATVAILGREIERARSILLVEIMNRRGRGT